MRLARPIGRFLLALSALLIVPAGIVLAAFQSMGPWFVAHEYTRAGFPPAERYEPGERLALAQQTARYIISPGGAQGLREMRRGDEVVYNEREVGHLVDVMTVLDGLRAALAAAGVIWLLGFGMALAKPAWRRPVARSTLWGSAALVAVLGGLLLASFLAFDSFFVRFHEVLFAADTWTFDYADSLIQFYPVEFWMDFFTYLGASILVGALAVCALSLAYLGRREVKR